MFLLLTVLTHRARSRFFTVNALHKFLTYLLTSFQLLTQFVSHGVYYSESYTRSTHLGVTTIDDDDRTAERKLPLRRSGGVTELPARPNRHYRLDLGVVICGGGFFGQDPAFNTDFVQLPGRHQMISRVDVTGVRTRGLGGGCSPRRGQTHCFSGKS